MKMEHDIVAFFASVHFAVQLLYFLPISARYVCHKVSNGQEHPTYLCAIYSDGLSLVAALQGYLSSCTIFMSFFIVMPQIIPV